MDSTEFLRQMSAQAQHDIKVPKTKLGFIDYDFDTTTYPQILPKVVIDGEGLSNKGFVCLNTYAPVPGDRVIMLPHSDSYVILGSIEKKSQATLDPGRMMFSANNHGTSQTWSGSEYLKWSDSLIEDPYDFWDPTVSSPELAEERTKIIPTISGKYRVIASVNYPTEASGNRVLQLRINGVAERGGRAAAADMVGSHVRINHEFEWDFNGTTDYVQVRCSLENGASYSGTFPEGAQASWLTLYYVGPRRDDVPTILQ